MWLALTLSGFVAFLACAFGIARLGFDASGQLLPRARWLVGATILSLAIWLFSLSQLPPPYPPANVKRYELPE